MDASPLSLRFAEASDQAALADLLLEAHQYYWDTADETAIKMTSKTAQALISGQSGCRALLAFQADTLNGFATLTLLHPAPNEHGTLFMKDLFVSQRARGTGLGTRMMQHLAQYAMSTGCSRFDWTAETDNPEALAFYDRLTATRVTEKVYFRLSDTDLKAFAERE